MSAQDRDLRFGPSEATANRSKAAILSMAVVMLLLALGAQACAENESEASASKEPPALRLISLNPSLTAIAFRLGAGDAIIGIDDYSASIVPAAADRPKVGGLFDPSLEAVVALRPDRVLVVAGIDQQSHADRLSKLGLVVDVYRNERLDQVLENIARLGRLLDREGEATARISAILAMRDAVATATADRARPATLAIVDRSPLYLVGGETFLDEMLEAVGARNLGRTLATGYPRGSIEWLIAARPELLLDMTPGAESAAEFWSRWPSLPAVEAKRALTVEASRVSMPGPDLDAALRELAIVVHGEAIGAAIDEALVAATEARGSEAAARAPAGAQATKGAAR